MSEDHLPPLHTRLIGGFLVLDKHIQDPTSRPAEKYSVLETGKTNSYIDLGFGYNKPGSTFCGVDRFAVTRDLASNTADSSDTGDSATPVPNSYRNVTISYSAMACNPSVNAITLSKLATSVHSSYAKLLFREGVARVLAKSGT